MAFTHPIFTRPVFHCGGCGNPLQFPYRRDVIAQKIADGHAVLGECNKCSVAVEVPAGLFAPSSHTHAPTTIARPWPPGAPVAVLTDEQKKLLGHPS